MPDPKSRLRVQRLISGDFRPDDLTALFLYARDHCDGREALSDIGHFVAHHHERDRGIITRSTREWFAVVRFHIPRLQNGDPLDGERMPSATVNYFEIAMNRIGRDKIKEHTGLLQLQAHHVLQGVVARMTKNADGTWALPRDLSAKELAVVKCAIMFLVSKPAFEDTTLFDDFVAMLKSNGLITRDELKQHGETLRPLVYLYAVAAMHNCVVQIGDGTTVKLRARAYPSGPAIHVDANVPDAVPGRPNVSVGAPIFLVSLDPAMHCHPSLAVEGLEWNGEVELAPDRRLCPLEVGGIA